MVNMILAKEINGEMWIKASDHNQAVKQAVEVEREACAKMIEDEPPLVDFAKNIYGACVVCGLTPKLIAAFIRARGQ